MREGGRECAPSVDIESFDSGTAAAAAAVGDADIGANDTCAPRSGYGQPGAGYARMS